MTRHPTKKLQKNGKFPGIFLNPIKMCVLPQDFGQFKSPELVAFFQVRLVILLEDQSPPDPEAPATGCSTFPRDKQPTGAPLKFAGE